MKLYKPKHAIVSFNMDGGLHTWEFEGSSMECNQHMKNNNSPPNWLIIPVHSAQHHMSKQVIKPHNPTNVYYDEFVDKDPMLADLDKPINPVEQAKLRRKEAMYWWISLRGQHKVILTTKYFPERKYYSLTDREIESMWIFETNYQYT